ncbi:MAG TPA: sigma-70 family RNA polymerase sigma factor [Humisphaera sp.]
MASGQNEAIALAGTSAGGSDGNVLAGEEFARAASVAAASSEAAAGIEAKAAADEALAAAAYGALSAKYARPSDRKVEWVRGAVARYERPLTQYAVHILGGDVERARDLVQEAFLRLCDQDEATVGTHVAEWLYTVCRNLAIDQRRKDRRMRLMTEEQEAAFSASNEGPTDAAERVDAYAKVVDALAGLPARQQEIVRLKFQHGLSYKEIGEVMNLTATNVGFILHTAIKALRTRFGAEVARSRDDEDVDPAASV